MSHNAVVLFVTCSLLCSCSGGGGGNSTKPTVQTGVFTDSAVMELHYAGQNNSGLTDSAGQFFYDQGESLAFSVGGIRLGSAIAAQEITPFDLLGVATLDEARERGLEDELANMVVFLQSLDRDQNPDNGIDLEGLDTALAGETLDFARDSTSFLGGDYRRIINQNGGYYRSSKSALNHLLGNLGQSVSLALLDRESFDTDGDGLFEQIFQYEYTDLGQVASIDKFNGTTGELETSTDFEYDSAGNLVLVTADRTTTEFEYDPLFGLLSQTERLDGEITLHVEFTYDSVGNLIRSETVLNIGVPIFVDASFVPTVILAIPISISISLAPVSGLSTEGDVVVASSIGEVRANVDPVSGSIPNSFPVSLFTGPRTSDPSAVTEVVLLNEYQYDENGNRVVAISSSNLDPGGTSTTTFAFENNRVVDIITGNESQRIEYHVEYDVEGHLVSCQAEIEGVPQTQLDPSNLLGNFPQANATTGVGGFSARCSDIVEYDGQGRATRIERPATSLFTGSIQEIEYLGDKIVLIRLDNNADSEFEEVREFDYSTSGEVIEARIIRDGEIVFRRVREYISMELPGIP